ncbi:cell division protein SepF [Pullulanibacillus sp. KACC 23026]|uniref:cell division protein SepF n=1 Tax=Pullulanibacillus sp. KACC 23026 TaxID=3028315 RepID=UPI0023AEB78A|nr:cell division protein SepF [Pullulanibacillus sp. KACC 23026]WEG11651.1 cell division protein SepF [Pullulanibacillus sp. KACC 23026]
MGLRAAFKRFFDLDEEYSDVNKGNEPSDYEERAVSFKSEKELKKPQLNNVIDFKRVQSTQQFVWLVPNHYDDVLEITDHLQDHKTVVFSIKELPIEEATRLLDFLSGAIHISQGTIQKIRPFVFIGSLDNLNLNGDFIEHIEQHVINH